MENFQYRQLNLASVSLIHREKKELESAEKEDTLSEGHEHAFLSTSCNFEPYKYEMKYFRHKMYLERLLAQQHAFLHRDSSWSK
jgi:hypothetical protein